MENQSIFTNGVVDSLNEFAGWGDNSQVDLFGIVDQAEGNVVQQPTQQTQNQQPTQQPQTQQQNVPTNNGQQTKEENDDVDLFKEGDDFENQNLEPTKQQTKTTSQKNQTQTPGVDYTSTVQNLKSLGILDFELNEGVELNNEVAREIFENEMDRALEQRVEKILESLPEDVRALNKYALNGGSLYNYMQQMQNASIYENDLNSLDLDDVEVQESIVRETLKRENPYLDDEDIDTQIELFKDRGKLYQIASKKLEAIKSIEQQRRQQLIEQQKEQQRLIAEQTKKAKSEMYDMISQNQEVEGIKFRRDDRNVLPSYVHDKTVKLTNGELITEFQKDLFFEVMSNPKAVVQLATLLKHRNKDNTFNFDSIYKSAETNVVKGIKENVRRNYTSNTPQQIQYRRVDELLT